MVDSRKLIAGDQVKAQPCDGVGGGHGLHVVILLVAMVAGWRDVGAE
jgi:hypothetical protein